MNTDVRRQLLIGDRLHILFGTIIGLFLAILAGLWAVGFAGNPIKAVVLALGGVLLVVGTLKPKVGLHALILCTTCLDFFKRLLITFGLGSMNDVMGVLAAAPMILAGIFLGTCLLYPIFTKKMLRADERHLVYAALLLIGTAFAAGYRNAGSIPELLGAVANQTAYALLLPIVFILYRGRETEDLKKLLRFTAFAYAPVALYGTFQYWFGLSKLEIEYLQSGLTTTVLNLYDIHPRPFSTLNSVQSYAMIMWFMVVISLYLAFHRTPRFRFPRWFPVVFVTAVIFSLSRGTMILTVANIVLARWFKTRKGTVIFYAVAVGSVVSLIVFSQVLLDSLGYLESFLPAGQDWQTQAFRLGTLSDRLEGYRGVLLNPEMYTLFGHGASTLELELKYGEEGYSHDSLSQLLYRFGIIGVAVFIVVAGFSLWRIHSGVWRLRDPEGKTLGSMVVSIVVLILFSHIGGGSYSVFPINFFIWFFLGIAWSVCYGLRNDTPPDWSGVNEPSGLEQTRAFRERRGNIEPAGASLKLASAKIPRSQG